MAKAAVKKKTGNKKKAAGAGGASAKKAAPAKRSSGRRTARAGYRDTIADEIVLCLLLAFCVLLFLGNFDLAGKAGRVIALFFKGVFGVMAYPFPVILLFGVAFLIANWHHERRTMWIIGSVLLFFSLTGFFQLILGGFRSGTPVVAYYNMAREGALAGGLTGGLVVSFFGLPFGTTGAYVLTFAMMIIAVIIITEKPLMSLLERHSADAIKGAAEKRRQRKLEKAEQERKLRLREPSASDDGSAVSVDLRRLLYGRDYEGSGETMPSAEESAKKQAAGRELSVSARRRENSAEPSYAERLSGDASLVVEDYRGQAGTAAGSDRGSEEPAARRGKERPKGGAESDALPAGERRRAVRTGRREGAVKNATGRDRDTDTGNVPALSPEIPKEGGYRFPELSLLTKIASGGGDSRDTLETTARKLEHTLRDFGVAVKVTHVSCGPAVTRYELEPEHGVKVSRIVALTDDIKLNLAAKDIRIEAPIPGKSAVGIEVPNKENSVVPLRDMLESREFTESKAVLPFAVGRDISGEAVIADISKMPHVLVAGATGSGKSVCINTLIMSILFKVPPQDVRMIMVDPKVVELSVYNGIPHLLLPVVTEPKKAAGALNWAVSEMVRRYNVFKECGANIRNIKGYNRYVEEMAKSAKENAGNGAVEERVSSEETPKLEHMPYLLIIVDELADLMMVSPGEVEQAICRIAQLGRAAGLHLVVATQRPSVNVITGLIKANMPSRIAFATTSGVDSRTILDMNGAERLLGKGDMLYYPQGYTKPDRVQGTYVPDEDVSAVVAFLTAENGKEVYNEELTKKIEESAQAGNAVSDGDEDSDGRDEYFWDAGLFIIEKEKASIGMLQRVFKIGFNRAARIMDQLCEAGVVAGEEGTKPRRILMTAAEFEALRENGASGDPE